MTKSLLNITDLYASAEDKTNFTKFKFKYKSRWNSYFNGP